MPCPGCSGKEDMVRVLLQETSQQKMEMSGGEDGAMDVFQGWIRYFYFQLLDNPVNSLCWVFLIGLAL
jgi:hypothetical protein